jgi:putative DNA methylase
MSKYRKKLIEVALPLEAINKASAREKSIRHGHPSTLHLWWSRKPLATARAVIFSQMVDDPSANPDLFPTEKAQEKERQRLFKIIEQLVEWENTSNEEVLEKARAEIWQSWRRACADNVDHLRAKELFDRNKLPAFHDPFAGGGALALEAARLGLEAYASELNPVAVLINKAMIEIPPKFGGRSPVNPQARSERTLATRQWKGAEGLAADVHYYGQLMREEAERFVGHLYPKMEVTAELTKDRPDLKPLVGKKLTVIAWLWGRTVKSPNPAFASVDVPLVSTFMLSSRGTGAYVEPVIENGSYRFTVKLGKPKNLEAAEKGTTAGKRSAFLCLMSGTPIDYDYIRAEFKSKRMGARLMAVVAEGQRGRIYLPPTKEMEAIANQAKPKWQPDVEFLQQALGFRVGNYGMTKWSDLFTPRQLEALTTFSDLVHEMHKRVNSDAVAAGLSLDDKSISTGGMGARAYADAVALYLALGVNRTANSVCTLVKWNKARDQSNVVFARQVLSMLWEYADVNPFAGAAGDLSVSCEGVAKVLAAAYITQHEGHAEQLDATVQGLSKDKVIMKFRSNIVLRFASSAQGPQADVAGCSSRARRSPPSAIGWAAPRA